jgi:hypothetical protein
MIQSTKLSEYLFSMATGENRVGSKCGERERESKRAVELQCERWSVGRI